MKNLRSNNAAGQSAGLRKGNLCAKKFALNCFFALFCAAFFATQTVQAQVTWIDMGGYKLGYELSTTATEIPANERFHIKLYGDAPISEEAIGVRFEVMLGEGVDIQGGGMISVPGSSWLGLSNELTTAHQTTAEFEEVQVHRTDLAIRDGIGWVISLHVQVGPDPVNASGVVANLGGSLVIMDNVQMRLAPSANTFPNQATHDEISLNILPNAQPGPATSTLRGSNPFSQSLPVNVAVYPNPCTNWFKLQAPGNNTWKVTVLSMDQTPVIRRLIVPGQSVDMQMFPDGTYIVILEEVNGPGRHNFTLLKR
ncbi:MAG: T9SS type A sorting domain-containing protein [Bacteroidota bacterium]